MINDRMNDDYRKQDLRRELLKRELRRRENEFFNNNIKSEPFGILRDIAAGGLRAGQNIAATLGEAGQAIGSLASPLRQFIPESMKRIPDVNIREELGLGHDRPVDVGSLVQGNNPNPLTQTLAQYGAGSLLGGPTRAGQVAGNALWGALQGQPNESHLGGLLPEGRPGAMMESAALSALPYSFRPIKNIFDKKFRPNKTYQDLLQEIGGNKDTVQNIQELGNRVQYANKTTKEEALLPKREIMQSEGESRLIPNQKRGESLVHDVSNIFSENSNKFNQNQINNIKGKLKNYYKTGDIEPLISAGEDIFEHPGLSKKEMEKLEELLIPERKITGNYLKIKEPDQHYSELLQEAHDNYVKNPTFINSDKLRSRLFKRINTLSERMKSKTITDAGEKELDSLIKNRNAIIKDQNKLIETFSPENKVKYGKFNKLWREDVQAYENANTTIKNMKNGHLNKITPKKISNAFSFPELNPKLQKVLKDIGPSGVNNIVFNELEKTTNIKKALQSFEDLKGKKGMSSYISPELEMKMDLIKSQLRNKKALGWGAGLLAGVLGTNHYMK